MHRLAVLALLPLVACASPQQQCIGNATGEVRVLDQLIATTEANVARGYAIQTQDRLENVKQVCGKSRGKDIYCDVPVAQQVEAPVAIDLDAEKAKLASLKTKRAQLAGRANDIIADCRARYPEA